MPDVLKYFRTLFLQKELSGKKVSKSILDAAYYGSKYMSSIERLSVEKCHRYGRYICVKILENWGKKCGRLCRFVKIKAFEVKFYKS